MTYIQTDIQTYIQTYIHTDRQTEPNYYIDLFITWFDIARFSYTKMKFKALYIDFFSLHNVVFNKDYNDCPK